MRNLTGCLAVFFFLDFAYVGIFRFSQNFDLETATNEIIIMIFVTYSAAGENFKGFYATY